MPTNDIDIHEEMAFSRLPITNKPSTAKITVENNTGTYSCITTDSVGKSNTHTKPRKPTKDTNATTCGKKRCAYCDTLNDHETGVCDRCGAPLL